MMSICSVRSEVSQCDSYIRLWRVILLLRNSYIATKVAVILKRYVRDVHTFLVKDNYLFGTSLVQIPTKRKFRLRYI